MANLPLPVLIPNHVDRLSNLPDELLINIFSFLPIHIAARTSVLARRFNHLWEASPSINLSCKYFAHQRGDKFIAMVDAALTRRNCSHPLLSFCIDHCHVRLPISSLLVKSRSFSLSHLTIESCFFTDIEPVLPAIFSIKSLQFLSLPVIGLFSYERKHHNFVLPSATNLTRLTTLCIGVYDVAPKDTSELNQLLSQLPSLQELQLGLWRVNEFNISSQTIRKLKLKMIRSAVRFETLRLFLPLLESLHLENDGVPPRFPTINGDIPLLRKVFLKLDFLCEKDVCDVNGLLHALSHVEELILNMKEFEFETHPFTILLEQREGPPIFPKLKHLDVRMCFHEQKFQAIASMLQYSPALESARLVHEVPKFITGVAGQRKRKDQESKLPPNADDTYHYAYFKNLHIWENRMEFMKFLGRNAPVRDEQTTKTE